MKTLTEADRISQKRADEIFDALDTFGRGSLAVYGTAFTTYEEEGQEVCAFLNSRAHSWRAALATIDVDSPSGGRCGAQGVAKEK